MKKRRYRIYLKNNTIVILSSDDISAVKEIAEQIALERKTTVLTITTF
jgi:hypothetical protein